MFIQLLRLVDNYYDHNATLWANRWDDVWLANMAECGKIVEETCMTLQYL